MTGFSRRKVIATAAVFGLAGRAKGQDGTPATGSPPIDIALPDMAVAVDPQLSPDPAELARLTAEFLNGATPQDTGLLLDLPPIGENPAQVPVRVKVTLPLDDELWCPELILLAEMNPRPLACRFAFTPAAGAADVGIRLRLTQSQSVTAYARLSDGRVLTARQQITVTAGGCGL